MDKLNLANTNAGPALQALAAGRAAAAAQGPFVRPRPRFGTYAKRTLRVRDAHLQDVLAGHAFLQFDGGMGTQLQARGLAAGEVPELLCLTNPQEVTEIHAAYVAAGAEVVTTNTFGASRPKLEGQATVEQVFSAAVACARAANPRYVAADIGPTGALLEPMGTLPFEDAYDLFAEQVIAADAAGADLFVIETMADLAEAKAAVLAAKENSDLPIFCTMTFGEDGRTFLGTTPEVAAVTLSALGVDALGINCSLGPADVAPLVARMLPWSRVPVMAQANAGLPSVVDGKTVFSVKAPEFCQAVAGMVEGGVSVVGGCCGTEPSYVAGETQLLAGRSVAPRTVRDDFVVASSQEICSLGAGQVGVIGERINPTGKKKMKEALRSGNYDYIMGLAIEQTESGAQILDVNAGLPEIDEKAVLARLMRDLQGVTNLPLQVDSAVPQTIEAAVRAYPGKALINSTNGKQDVLDAVVPIAAHYGCALVGLTIDEDGIPATAEGRLAVARKIVAKTDEWGIPRQDVAIDCLTMACSTDQTAPRAILDGIRLVKRELPGVRTVLGVSNISFGLPFRPLVNATFLAACFGAGLDLASCLEKAQAVDKALDAALGWAYSEKYGYLTASPVNLGCAMRAGVCLHLPMIAAASGARTLANQSARMGYELSGVFGEGSCMYLLSNAKSLGTTEKELVTGIESAAEKIMEREREMRAQLYKDSPEYLENRVYRALGLLGAARVITFREATALVSDARLGAGVLSDVQYEKLDRILRLIGPCAVSEKGGEEESEKTEVRRAQRIRRALA